MTIPALGSVVQSFFVDHLQTQKGLRPASVRSYRDVLRLFLCFVAQQARRKITRLTLEELSGERVQQFLRHLEQERHNHIRTRNHRLAALRTFYEYLASRVPELLATCQRVAAIPSKRSAPAPTHFLEREEVAALLAEIPSGGRYAVRDRALLLLLYNSGARAQEVAELRVVDLDLTGQPRVRLHGKGDKWRCCPLWAETVGQLQVLLRQRPCGTAEGPVFVSRPGRALTRFGIYKVVRRYARSAVAKGKLPASKPVSPHTLRHTAAVHLLESGVEVNVIRSWLGHTSLETTNRYAEITASLKAAALQACEPPTGDSASSRRKVVWQDDETLLAWLESL